MQDKILTTSGIDTYVDFFCFPWKNKKSIIDKIASWAIFFFAGWIYHPIQAIHQCHKRITLSQDPQPKSNTIFINEIMRPLVRFNNSRIIGKVNGIYVTTNEVNLAATYQLLKEHPRPDRQIIHIGCASLHNFDMMCLRKSNYALIVDFNPKNAAFIEKTKNLIDSSESRKVFVQKMICYLNSLSGEDRDMFCHSDQIGLPTERIEKELTREGSWLQTEENYIFIKNLISKGSLITLTEDIRNHEVFSGIKKFLDSNNIFVDSLYLSNICNFMKNYSDKYNFIQSIKHILNVNSIFINCLKIIQTNSSKAIILHQIATLGKEVLNESYDTKRIFDITV